MGSWRETCLKIKVLQLVLQLMDMFNFLITNKAMYILEPQFVLE